MAAMAVAAVAGIGAPLFFWMYRKQAEEARRTIDWWKASIQK
jgi:hypothetical protein